LLSTQNRKTKRIRNPEAYGAIAMGLVRGRADLLLSKHRMLLRDLGPQFVLLRFVPLHLCLKVAQHLQGEPGKSARNSSCLIPSSSNRTGFEAEK
jgi:hypothetical protein